jgi:serine/threonine protein kinase
MSQPIKIKNYVFFPDQILGKGGFSEVYLGFDILKQEKVAIKKDKKENEFLDNECHVICSVWKHMKRHQITFKASPPVFCDFFTVGDFKYLVLKQYQYSLLQILRKIKSNYDKESITRIFNELHSFLLFLHSLGYVHRDIKPDNLMFSNNMKKVILIDYGLATKKSKIMDKNPVGSVTFMSVNLHFYRPYSFKDDFISFCYTLIYLINGSLPWQKIKSKSSKEKFRKIGILKAKYPIEKLCEGCPDFIYKLLVKNI